MAEDRADVGDVDPRAEGVERVDKRVDRRSSGATSRPDVQGSLTEEQTGFRVGQGTAIAIISARVSRSLGSISTTP